MSLWKRWAARDWFPSFCTLLGGGAGLVLGVALYLLIHILSDWQLGRTNPGNDGKGAGAAILLTLFVCVFVWVVVGSVWGGVRGSRLHRRAIDARSDPAPPLH